ncbi:MAG TPA: hypothetical protein VLT16_00005, partial [Candidatus Limnocylindrales bacterium]|nr:hypothetical protein [Candidatus Limnocylindrales bacterium]
MRAQQRIVLFLLLLVPGLLVAQKPPAEPALPRKTDSRAWIKRSNDYAQILLQIQAKYAPEFAARVGIEGLDDQVTQFPQNHREQLKADLKSAITQLQQDLAAEKDPLVREDLQIMITTAQRNL